MGKEAACQKKKKKKSIKALTRRLLTKANKMGKDAASRKTEEIHQSLNPTAFNRSQ